MKNLSHRFQANTDAQFVFRRSRQERQTDRAERRKERAELKESGVDRKKRREKIQELRLQQKQERNKLSAEIEKDLSEENKKQYEYTSVVKTLPLNFDQPTLIETVDKDVYEEPVPEEVKPKPTLDEKIIKVKEELKDLPENSNERFELEGKRMNLEWMKKMELASPEEREKLLSGTMKIAAYVAQSPEKGADLWKREIIIITDLLERIDYAMKLSNIKQTPSAITDISSQLQQKRNLIETQMKDLN